MNDDKNAAVDDCENDAVNDCVNDSVNDAVVVVLDGSFTIGIPAAVQSTGMPL